MRFLPLIVFSIACSNPTETGSLLDTGWFIATDEGPVSSCEAYYVDSDPLPGIDDWYWRAWPQVWTNAYSPDSYTVRLIDTFGRTTATVLQWSEDGLSFGASYDTPLEPSTHYTLEITDCRGTHEVPFMTSELGSPLLGGPTSLVGNTYQLNVQEATWVEPSGFGPILSLYLETPILIGVLWADTTQIDLAGAQGIMDEFGNMYQVAGPLWEFPMASFEEHPYFHNQAEEVLLEVLGYTLPIFDFDLTGTFDAAASGFAGGTMSGLGDTRDLGGTLGTPNDEAALCNFAADLGVPCIACPDGNPYCLNVVLSDVTGTLIEDLILVREQ